MLYKIQKNGNPIRFLTTECNTAIEKLLRHIKKICTPLTGNIEARMKDIANLLEIFANLNTNQLQKTSLLVSFDTVCLFQTLVV